MSARSVIEHALRVYYVDSAEPNAIARDLLAQYDAERNKEKATAPAATATLEPLTVRWDRTVIHPEADPTDDTLVCCLTDDGRPVALFLDDEHREALGLLLVDPNGEDEAASQVTGRLAQLLDAIRTHRGQWTPRKVQQLYRTPGINAPLRATAKKDLHALPAMGHLVMHEDKGRRYFTLNTRKDGA